MNFFSTFAGIGGFDLGLERAGWRCAGQCEIEPYCNAVLEKHWPKVWRHPNVKTLTGELIRQRCGHLDALVGGPPCQPSSVAGERRGAADDRWMWPDYLRLVSEINDTQERPLLWLLAENPRGVLSIDVEGMRFSEWLARELAARGYELLPVELAAEDVGAPHRRQRIWFVGYATSARLAGSAGREATRQVRNETRRQEPARSNGRGTDVANRLRPERRTAAEGRSDDDHRTDAGRQEAPGRPALRREAMANGNGTRQHEPSRSNGKERRRTEDYGGQWPARPGEPQHKWEAPRVVAAQSQMGSAIDGLSRRLAGRRRVAALKALGNAVVPQCAQILGEMINRYEEKQ